MASKTALQTLDPVQLKAGMASPNQPKIVAAPSRNWAFPNDKLWVRRFIAQYCDIEAFCKSVANRSPWLAIGVKQLP